MPLSVGDKLGPYEIIEPLGAGGMGEVYRAKDTRLGRDIAIKVLPDSFSSPLARERFLREARACSALSHPNICAIHDLGDSEGRPYLVMELLEGQTLRHLIASHPIDPAKALEIAIQLARALEAAHSKGIIHRDIKPSNIVITPDGQVKVLDFGLAKIADALPNSPEETAIMDDLTVPGSALGTYAYMSPEQARGGSVDARSDIWSLGVVLYEMATGSQPFTGATSGAVLEGLLTRNPLPLRQRNPQIRPDLEPVVLQALAKEPSLRYQSAGELRAHLERLAHVPPDSNVQSARPPKWLIPALAGAALVILILAGVYWARHAGTRSESNPQSIAVLPFVNLSSDQQQQYFSDGLAEDLLNGLAGIPNLRVTARASAFQFRDKNEDPRVIGKKLNVAMILEGSVRRQGPRIRITAQLVKAADGFLVWSDVYDRDLNDLLSTQEEIARAVTGALKIKLAGGTAGQSGGSKNPEAYTAFLQAQYFSHTRTKDGLEKAAAFYQQAVSLDPGYALAWARLGAVRANQAAKAQIPLAEGYREAKEEVQRALAIDPNLSIAHAVMGWIQLSYDWNWPAADASLKRAIALEPGNAVVVQNTASLDKTLGRFDEGAELLRRGIALDPLNADFYYNLGLILTRAGKQEEAVTALHKALELRPEYGALHVFLAEVYLIQSRPQQALAELQKEPDAELRLIVFPLVYHALGRKKDADTALRQLIAKLGSDDAYQVAEAYAYLGDRDRALQWLDRAFSQRDAGLTEIQGDALLKNLQHDPRYAAFLKKMGF